MFKIVVLININHSLFYINIFDFCITIDETIFQFVFLNLKHHVISVNCGTGKTKDAGKTLKRKV